VISAVERHAQDVRFADDLTILLARRTDDRDSGFGFGIREMVYLPFRVPQTPALKAHQSNSPSPESRIPSPGLRHPRPASDDHEAIPARGGVPAPGPEPGSGTYAQQTPPVDGILRLLLRLEQLMQAGQPEAYMDVLSAVADRRFASEASRALIGPGITRAVIRERDRAPSTARCQATATG